MLQHYQSILIKQKTVSKKSVRFGSVFYLLLTLLVQSSLVTNAQLVNIPVTGFNNDIVANGVGTNAIVGITHNTIGVDGARYYFIDNTYKYTSSKALPTCYMPTSNSAVSLRTPGLTYSLQSYSANNALTIDNNSTAYTTSPFPNTGALTFTNPASYSKLYVLYESVINVAPLNVDVTVTFTDATTQVFNNNACVNWFTATLPAFTNVGRGTPTGDIQCGAQPNLFELQLTISAGNTSKLVQSISFTIPTAFTVGANPFNVNYFHAMAVGGQIAPLSAFNNLTPVANIRVYPNPANEQITVSSESFLQNSFFALYDVTGREVKKERLLTSTQQISLAEVLEGFFFYKIFAQGEIIATGKLNHSN